MNINLGGLLGAIAGGALGAGLAFMLVPDGPRDPEAFGRMFGSCFVGGLIIGAIAANVLWDTLVKRR